MTRGLDRCGVGVASVVTLGAKADVSGNDLLQAWSDDPTVRVAVLQLESLGNPFRFARIARTVGRDLPVVLLRTAGLHESLTADDAALLRQLGIIDVPSIDEAIDVAVLLATEPPPAGRLVGIVSRGRGPGLVARDQLQDLGLHVTHVRAVTPDRAFVEDVRAMRDTPGIDALCLVPAEGDEVPRSAGPSGLPVVVCDASQSPGRSARALARSALHAEWARQAGQLVVPPSPPDRRAVRTILSESPCRASGGWIDLDSVTAALRGLWHRRHETPRRAQARRRRRSGLAGRLPRRPRPPRRPRHRAPPRGHEPCGPGRGMGTAPAPPRPGGLAHRRAGRRTPTGALGPHHRPSTTGTGHEPRPVRPTFGAACAGCSRSRSTTSRACSTRSSAPPGSRPSESPSARLVVGLAGLVADNPELVEVHLDAIDTSSAPALVTGAHLAIAPAPARVTTRSATCAATHHDPRPDLPR